MSMGNAVWAEETEAVDRSRASIAKYMSYIQEHLLKELLTNKTYGLEEWGDYLSLLNRNREQWGEIRVIVFRLEDEAASELLFALRNIMEETLRSEHAVLGGTTIGERVALLLEDCEAAGVWDSIERGLETFRRYFRQAGAGAWSDPADARRLWRAYASAERRLGLAGGEAGERPENGNETSDGGIVEAMTSYIESHLADESLSLGKLSKEVLFMNGDYLGKLFKRKIGEKFSQYVTRRRLETAVRLMKEREELRLVEVAERVGYGRSPHYFSRLFKKTLGCTPTEYRRRRPPRGLADE